MCSSTRQMAFTWFDCQFFRGSAAPGDSSSYACFSPVNEAGTLVFVGSRASKDNIGSQVACKLALEHFIKGASKSLAETSRARRGMKSGDTGGDNIKSGSVKSDRKIERGPQALEDAFRNANNSVYQFGHKLSAGGRLATSLMGLIICDGTVAVGRVGTGSTYLYRGSQIFPFFEAPGGDNGALAGSGSAVGSNSLVSVELASVDLEEFDRLLILPEELDRELEPDLLNLLEKKGVDCSTICRSLLSDNQSVSFSLLLSCGPLTTYLGKTLKLSHAPADIL